MLTSVEINATEIAGTHLQSWKITEQFTSQPNDCTIIASINIYDDIPDLTNNSTVVITRGILAASEQNVFNGYVDEIEKQGNRVVIKCKDKLKQLRDRSVTYSYDQAIDASAGVGSAIAQDLIETWGELNATVVSTGSTVLINKFICKHTDVLSRLQILCDIYDYQLYYDADDDTVHFEPKGVEASGYTIYVGGPNSNVANVPKWKIDTTELVNSLTILGAVQEVQEEEYFNGDGSSEQTFTLTKNPVTIQAWEDVAGTWVLKTPGIEDSTETFDYYANKEQKTINCTTNWSPGSGTNNVWINYTTNIPVPVLVEDDVSQDTYGKIENTMTFSDVQTIADAEKRGKAWLNKYSNPFYSTTIKVIGIDDVETGQTIDVVDTYNSETRTVMIIKIQKEYPHNADTLEVGDEIWRTADWGFYVLERIKRLEEQLSGEIEFLVHVKYLKSDLKVKARYLQILTQSINNALIIGTDINSKIGVYNGIGGGQLIIGTGGYAAEVEQRLIWNNSTYWEDFRTTTFKSTNTTATWDTTNRQINFDAGEVGESVQIVKTGSNFTSAIMTVTGFTNIDNFTLMVSSDGGEDWATVTNGVTHTFSSGVTEDTFPMTFPFTFGGAVETGDDLRWRIEASATDQLTGITIEYS